jgi:hypothetical protein
MSHQTKQMFLEMLMGAATGLVLWLLLHLSFLFFEQ